MADARTDLPAATAGNFAQRVRETLMTLLGRQGSVLDRAITLRDLLGSGLATLRAGYASGSLGSGTLPLDPGASVEPAYEPDLTPPPTPSGFSASAAISHIFVEHDNPIYTQGHGHLRTRVYGAVWTSGPLPVFANAVEIDQFSGVVRSIASNPSTTWHLWVKWETNDNVLSSSPAGGTNGVAVTTGQDVATLLAALQGEIAESQLTTALSARINLVDGSGAGSVNQRIAVETDARVLSDDILTNAQAAEVDARALADSALSAAQAVLSGAVGTNAAALLAESNARTLADGIVDSAMAAVGVSVGDNAVGIEVEQQERLDADGALASQTTSLLAAVGDNAAALVVEQTVRANQDSALSSQVTSLAAVAGDAAAALVAEQQVRADADGALSSQVTTISAAVGDNSAALVVEQVTRADSDSAMAGQVTTLAADVGSNAAALVVEQQARADADGALSSQVTTLAVASGDSAAALVVEQTARADSDSALSSQVTTLAAAAGDSAAAIVTEQTARADADAATASQITSLASSVGDSAAAIVLEQQTRADADSAQAAQSLGLAATVGDSAAALVVEQVARADAESATASQVATLASATGENAAAIATEQTARTTADSALGSQVTVITASVGENAAAIFSEQTTRASQDGALASQIDVVAASAGDNTVAIQTEATTRASETGALFAQYTVKLDLNGRVSGFGLASEAAVDETPFSEFAVRVDRFYLAAPTDFSQESTPTAASAGQLWFKPSTEQTFRSIAAGTGGWVLSTGINAPFIVQTTPTIIDGIVFEPGVYMDAARIINLSAMVAKFQKATIDDAMIAELSADKIRGGSLTLGEFIASADFIQGEQGWYIDGDGNAEFDAATIRGLLIAAQIDTRGLTIKDANGTVVFSSGVPLATTYIADAAVTTAKIGNLAVTNSKINDLNGDKITANTIKTGKLIVGSFDNLATNPGFEADVIGGALDPHSYFDGSGTGWSTYTSSPRSGVRAARYDVGAQSSNAAVYCNGEPTESWHHMAATEGDAFYLEAYVKYVGTGTVPQCRVTVAFRDETGTLLASTPGTATAPGTTFSLRSVTSAAAPAGTVYVTFHLFVLTGGASTQAIVWDDVYARRTVSSAIIDDAAITTAKIGDLQVATLKISDNAVTIPTSAYTAASISVTSSWVTVQSVTFTSTGATVHISAACLLSYVDGVGTTTLETQFDILRDTVSLATGVIGALYAFNGSFCFPASDTPSSGSHTYYLKLKFLGDGGSTCAATKRTLMALETKK